MRPTIGVLALQGDFREHVHALQRCGIQQPVLVRTPSDLAKVQGMVVPGGESTAISKLAVAFEVLEPIRQRIAEGMPVYGSCAGMIMLADTILDARSEQTSFGGLNISVRRNAFGRQVDSFEAELHAPAFGDEAFKAIFIRAPWVESHGPDVEVLARVESGPHAGAVVAVAQDGVMATSFHPELTTDDRVHSYFIRTVENRA
jgi:5'-phosphate synthase pdxT subunit